MTRMASGFWSRRTGSRSVLRKSRKTGIAVPVGTVFTSTIPVRLNAPDRQALPVHRGKTARALANLGTGIAPRHVRQDSGLIHEHQARRIHRGHVFAVDRAFGRDIRSLLLARTVFLYDEPVALQGPADT